MKTDFHKLESALKEKHVALQNYCDFLQFETSSYPQLSKYLKQQNVDLKKYQEYLSKETNPLDSIKKISLKLLMESKISLEELNSLLNNFPLTNLNKKNFLQALLREQKIDIDAFLPLFQEDWELNENTSYEMKISQENVAFYLKESKDTSQFGKYQILEELGRGAMGIVYQAYHTGLNRIIALKIMAPRKGPSDNTTQRFLREVQAMAKLEHSGIVQIIDTGQEEERFYFAMEFVKGTTFKTYLEEKRKKFSTREFLGLMIKILEALFYAHQQGIVHRDLKPENIFISHQKEPKIGDFGLAKIQDSPTLTQSGTILGTASYMSPEQANGEASKLDHRSDLYSMGVFLYQGLTGKLPFTASNLQTLLFKIIKIDPPPPSQWNKTLHHDLETIILKSIEKEPKARYQTAQEFAKDLECFLKGFPIQAKSASQIEKMQKWVKRNRYQVLFSNLFCFLILAFIFFFQWKQHQDNKNDFNALYQEAKKEMESLSQTPHKISLTQQSTHLLKAFTLLNTALLKNQGEIKAEKTKWEVGTQLLQMTYQKQEYFLAQYLIQQLKQLKSIKETEREQLQKEFETQKTKTIQMFWKRFQGWKKHLQTHYCNKEKKDDAIFEISKMQEKKILEELLHILQEGNHYFIQNTSRTSLRNQYYQVMITALGRLENSKATIPLFKALQQIQKAYKKQKPSLEEVDYIVTLSYAFLYSKPKNAAEDFRKIRSKFGTNSLIGKRIRYVHQKLLNSSLKEDFSEKEKLSKSDLEKMAKAEYYQKNYPKAIEIYTQILDSFGPDPDIFSSRSALKAREKDIEGAIADLTEAIRLKPNEEDHYRDRGNLKREIEDFEGALSDLNEAIRLKPSKGKFYSDRGAVKEDQKQYQDALMDYQKAIELDPQRTEAYLSSAKIKIELKNYFGAMSDYNKALQLEPKDDDIYRNRGYLKEIQGDLEGALNDYEQAIHLKPSSPANYNSRGGIKIAKKNLQEAILDFKETLRLQPDYAIAYHNLGYCYYKLEEEDLAIQMLTQANDFIEIDTTKELLLQLLQKRILKNFQENDRVSLQADIALFKRYASKKHPAQERILEIEKQLNNTK